MPSSFRVELPEASSPAWHLSANRLSYLKAPSARHRNPPQAVADPGANEDAAMLPQTFQAIKLDKHPFRSSIRSGRRSDHRPPVDRSMAAQQRWTVVIFACDSAAFRWATTRAVV
jgi:hypothetical protein